MTAVRFSLAVVLGTLTGAARLPASPPITALAYRADGALLAAGTHGDVVLIDPKTGADVGVIRGIPGRVTGLAFSKAGLLAVACGEPGKRGEVRAYDLATGRPAPHTPAVVAVQ